MPADIALAGICAAAACCAGISAGVSVFCALPAGLFGIMIWKLRLSVNARFMRGTEKRIEKGQTWQIMISAVLAPSLFSAAVCIPVGALFSGISYHIARYFAVSAISTAPVMKFLAAAGLIICAAGLVLPLFPVRDVRTAAAFVVGALAVPVLRVPLILLFIPALLVFYLAVRTSEQKTKAAFSAGSFDPDFAPAPAPDFDPDLDPDFDPDFDLDFNPGFDPDLAAAENGSTKKSAAALRSSDITIPVYSLAACDLLWILFVQTCYNTRLMMGQAAAVAFLPVAKALYPDDPARQQDVLQRQCVYLNTQPELGSCLIGRLAAMERQGSDSQKLCSVRSSLMGVFGAIGDELFQCGLIPILLLLFSDLVIRGGSAGTCVLLYAFAAVVSAALLSAFSFRGGFFHDEMEILNLLESGLFHRIRHMLDLLLPFFRGAALGTIVIRVLLPLMGLL